MTKAKKYIKQEENHSENFPTKIYCSLSPVKIANKKNNK